MPTRRCHRESRSASRRTVRMLLTLGATAIGLSTAGSATAAAAAPVPCTPAGAINGLPKFNCQFYPAGNGISGGTPVVAANGARVGFLRQGTNFVLCQRVGGTVRAGRNFNNNWAYTQADNLRFGWVNAVYGKGGENNGAFRGVPVGCNPSAGNPPGDATTAPVHDPRPADQRFSAAVRYIHGEIQTNARSRIVRRIRALNVGVIVSPAPAKAAAGLLWRKQVKPNGPWDHKPLLKRKFNMRSEDDFFMDVPGTASRVYYDIWSNIHYGYVGRVAGFTATELIVAQNLPGTGEHSKADDLKVKLGIWLHKQYPRLRDLTEARIQRMIVAYLPRLQALDPVWSVRPRR